MPPDTSSLVYVARKFLSAHLGCTVQVVTRESMAPFCLGKTLPIRFESAVSINLLLQIGASPARGAGATCLGMRRKPNRMESSDSLAHLPGSRPLVPGAPRPARVRIHDSRPPVCAPPRPCSNHCAAPSGAGGRQPTVAESLKSGPGVACSSRP